jgi:glycosyltransferase involved in cell wall biosynthesis
MRILLANDGIGDPGGVQSYLAALIPALAARGHQVALLHVSPLRPGARSPAPAGAPHFCVDELGADGAVFGAMQWEPELCFTHNMGRLEVEERLLAALPVVRMMHGYNGTCVSGEKSHNFPRATPCGRRLGPGCLALYFPRRCGSLSPARMMREWEFARRQERLLGRYAAVVTPSEHMRAEFLRHGVAAARAFAIPLFPAGVDGAAEVAEAPARFRVLFMGRMTARKGGGLLLRALAEASRTVGASIPATFLGEGPRRPEWERLARGLGVDATFTGWLEDEAKAEALRSASVLAVPSVWPEPFGLIGPEAGAFGIPALAFDVGGVRDWLTDGGNGWLVRADPPRARDFAEGIVRAFRAGPALAGFRARAREAALRLSLARHLDALEPVLLGAALPGAELPR